MTNGALNLDERLAQLVEVTRQQGENITRQSQEQRDRFDQLLQIAERQTVTAERQQAIVERLTTSVERFALVFADFYIVT